MNRSLGMIGSKKFRTEWQIDWKCWELRKDNGWIEVEQNENNWYSILSQCLLSMSRSWKVENLGNSIDGWTGD